MPEDSVSPLGKFLRDRRTRLDPASFGFGAGRRRTPGLRREEVAQRSNISSTWYTWLEQGRGGAPSADVLDRIAAGLMLTEPEREHMYMLAFGHPPEARYRGNEGISPRLQRVLDAMPVPAMIRTATWDVVAWNAAAAVALTDYGAVPASERNILKRMFSDSRMQAAQEDWLQVARYVVATFRADVTRAGASHEIVALVEELSRTSAEFEALWRSNDVVGHTGDGVKRLRHPELGTIELEFSTFAVEGRPELNLMVYNPVAADVAARIRGIVAAKG
ncbi:helix-turn-helix transcriptional regulator [Sphingomonas sp. KR3-1]|uniref:helix-turn-helix transcriptional regulator n=1 Tax=Sphingomonas sp. KR3-1 TaxID=3156611 RepID=UPI0032B59A74